ncbi:MAG: RNA polymerase sigma factor [Acidobacteriota bacterium]
MGTYIATISPLEASLITRVQQRDENAFQELFSRFRQKIFRTALRILKEEQSAEDALQETFINVYRAAGRFRGDSKLGTWINRIAVNVCLEILRKNKKHQQRTEEDISENSKLLDERIASPFEKVRRNEVREKVQNALARLGSKHRTVVKLHDLRGFTIREIASQLGVAEGTVKSRLFYGREELKRQLV